MLFGLFKNKKDKPKEHDEYHDAMQYDVIIATNFTDEDRGYMKPIYTIKYYSKLKDVVNEAIFCKGSSITLSHAFLTLEEILKQSIEDKLLISTIINQNSVLTRDEKLTIEKMEYLVKPLHQ